MQKVPTANMEKENKQLVFKLLPPAELSELQIQVMYELMVENYNHVQFDRFLKDLTKKQFAGILVDDSDTIRGFTTFAINPGNSGTAEYNIIFSGDTIISPSYWGTLELMRGWCHSVAKIISTDTRKKWYWFLLSKGHRTYMFMPLFFKSYHPSVNKINAAELISVLEESALKIYPYDYVPGSGRISFAKNMGELKPDLAKATYDKSNKPHVKLFLEKNPGFYKGDELVCIAEIKVDNFQGYALKFFLEGLGEPMPNLTHD